MHHSINLLLDYTILMRLNLHEMFKTELQEPCHNGRR